ASRERHVVLQADDSPATLAFVNSVEGKAVALSGAACPDHLVHTKPWPLWIDYDGAEDAGALASRISEGMLAYADSDRAYFAKEHDALGDQMTIDDAYPRIIVIPRVGIIATGKDAATARISADIFQRAIEVMRGAHTLGGFTPLAPSEDYGVEYWPLE